MPEREDKHGSVLLLAEAEHLTNLFIYGQLSVMANSITHPYQLYKSAMKKKGHALSKPLASLTSPLRDHRDRAKYLKGIKRIYRVEWLYELIDFLGLDEPEFLVACNHHLGTKFVDRAVLQLFQDHPKKLSKLAEYATKQTHFTSPEMQYLLRCAEPIVKQHIEKGHPVISEDWDY